MNLKNLTLKDFVVPIILAVVLGAGSVIASHDREISGIATKLESVHEDVKVIKDTLIRESLQNRN